MNFFANKVIDDETYKANLKVMTEKEKIKAPAVFLPPKSFTSCQQNRFQRRIDLFFFFRRLLPFREGALPPIDSFSRQNYFRCWARIQVGERKRREKKKVEQPFGEKKFFKDENEVFSRQQKSLSVILN